VQKLFDEYGTDKVLLYMKEIQLVARETVENFFRQKYDQFAGRTLRATDWVSLPSGQRADPIRWTMALKSYLRSGLTERPDLPFSTGRALAPRYMAMYVLCDTWTTR